jgi:hypothetical protein
MRHVVAQAGFQHAEAPGDAHGAAVAVGETDHAAAALVDGAGAARQQCYANQGEISEQEIVRDALERLRFRTGADQALRLGFRAPFHAVIVDHHAPALIEAQHG